ncbi:phenylalanine--tRNA ligase subunit beta [Marinicrinis sediminis]|uniref:Phenylalanine--tRNA ligase beta subunit n=1 Tax=Marinicrinis sediminis TaxID=1652465 RepID=A0ABW5R8F8_9BACL
MKVSYQWLSQYIDVQDLTAAELAEKMTRSGIEVDIVENRNQGVSKVVVGYVKSKESHPDADKLNVTQVDVGGEEDLQIVCGAKNVDAGQKVAVAVVGAVLPGDFKIKKAKLRGVASHGMICSAKELGINDKLLPKELQEGIMVLPEDVEVGTDVVELLGLNDHVLELDLTPNRADCLSMLGTAYELGAILDREISLPQTESGKESHQPASDAVQVRIEAASLCSHYAAAVVDGIKVQPSPLWLQNRLMAAGIRPINNIVDVTNFVMLEYGQPLHAFDADKVKDGQVIVRQAREEEQIVTLDDQKRTLAPEDLVIADAEKAIAIAGVMGGANSEVSEATTRIILESAKFDGGSVRKTSRKLGLRSEASLRFEKEVDPAAVRPALQRAAALMADIAGGQVWQGVVEQEASKSEPLQLTLTMDRVNRYLGTTLSLSDIEHIFKRLQFHYEQTGENELRITVPTRKGDITRDVDLIEEIARLYGYDQIPTTLVSGVTTPGALTRDQKIRRLIRHQLTESGLHEAINYSFTHPEWSKSWPGMFADGIDVPLAMPMSEERSVLRTSLIPHLIETAEYNRNHSNYHTAVFEIGSVFISQEQQISKQPQEQPMLAMLWTGHTRQTHWSGKARNVDFYDLKGVLDQLLAFFGLEASVRLEATQLEGMHPGRTARIVLDAAGESMEIGRMGQLHPELQKEHDLEDTYVLEMKLEPLYTHASFGPDYRMLPKFPAMTRDMAIVVSDDVAVGEVIRDIRQSAGELLESVDVFDIFRGDKVGEGKKSVALSLVYRHPERTLTDEEVTQAHGQVLNKMEETYEAELRK